MTTLQPNKHIPIQLLSSSSSNDLVAQPRPSIMKKEDVHEKVEVELDRQEQLHKIESEWICSINKFGKILAIYDKS